MKILLIQILLIIVSNIIVEIMKLANLPGRSCKHKLISFLFSSGVFFVFMVSLLTIPPVTTNYAPISAPVSTPVSTPVSAPNSTPLSATENSSSMEEVSLEYYYQPGCSLCIEKEAVVDEFLANYPINYSKIAVVYGENDTLYYQRQQELNLRMLGTPGVIFIKGDYAIGLGYPEINYDQMVETYFLVANYTEQGNFNGDVNNSITPWLSFVSGFLTGLSPCIILILAVVTPSFSAAETNKRHFIKIFSGLALGIISMYILIGLVILNTLSLAAQIIYSSWIKWGLGGLLLGLGLWFILDAFSEQSKLFSTPVKVKEWIRKMMEKGTFFYGYLLGFIFSIIKIPCIGAIMISLFLGLADNLGYNLLNLGLFYFGLILPIIVVLILILRGINSEKIEKIRRKYRPLLRILSGLAIIGLTLYSILIH